MKLPFLPPVQGCELFSNYGALSNEKLLFAYGFALPDNPFDAFAVKLKTSPSLSQDSPVYYLSSGGMKRIPAVLFEILIYQSFSCQFVLLQDLWKALSVLVNANSSEEAVASTHDDDGAGQEEAAALLDFLAVKIEQLEEAQDRYLETICFISKSYD